MGTRPQLYGWRGRIGRALDTDCLALYVYSQSERLSVLVAAAGVGRSPSRPPRGEEKERKKERKSK